MPTTTERRKAPLMARNAERHHAAAADQVDRAELAAERLRLARPTTRRQQEMVARYREAVQLRLEYPDDTLAQLATRASWSKDRYWAILSRAFKYGSGR